MKSQPENLDALYLRGKAFYYLGQNDAAINHFREALKYDPENSKCKAEFKKIKKVDKALSAGDSFLSQGKAQDALAEFTTALETDSENPVILPRIYLSQCKCYVQVC